MSNKQPAVLIVKKSKFLGFCFYLKKFEEIKNVLADLQSQYDDARHIVYAYRFQEAGVLKEKFYNSKEPQGTAGPPLLSLLQKKEITNCLLVVVRYFGGVKLGPGGLVRAYTQAAKQALSDCGEN